jgi:hypothetical protein
MSGKLNSGLERGFAGLYPLRATQWQAHSIGKWRSVETFDGMRELPPPASGHGEPPE